MKNMEEKNKDLQSRREFFKTAAKGVLPILGLTILSPIVLSCDKLTDCDDCTSSCSDSCVTGCKNTCSASCKSGCKTTCSTTCSGGCKKVTRR